MSKRRIIAILIALVLTLAATAMWTASTIERDGDPDAIVLDDSGSEVGASVEPKKKGGNKVVKVLTAPFKAVGRLFGRGGDDTNKITRMNEKDAERFESVAITRVEDARTVKRDTSGSSAREHLEAGRELLLNGAYSEAVSELSTAISLDPGYRPAIDNRKILMDTPPGERLALSTMRVVDFYEDKVKARPGPRPAVLPLDSP